MRRSALTAVLLICVLPEASAATSALPARFEACADIADFPELAGSQCLLTSVPLRHEAPDADAIELFVRRFPASEPARRRGEIWLVAGGPGESGAAFHPLLPTFRRAFPHHDLVMPDHRGTGRSEKLCPAQESSDSPDGIALAAEEWGPCIGALYADPARTAAFTITQAAHDLAVLVSQQRGDGEVLLYGVSYGTQLSLRMLQVAPVPLDGLILDGLVPPDTAPHWDLSHRTAVVDEVGRAVLGDAGSAAYRQLLDTVDPATWRDVVPGGDLRRFMGSLLNFPDLRLRIPQIIERLAAGDTVPLATAVADLQAALAGMSRYPQSPPSLPLVMLISASENNARRGLTRDTVDTEARGALFTSPLPGFLVDSPVPLYDRDDAFGGTPAALPRTLVIHGTLDPNTPYAGAQAHARALTDAGPLTFSTVERGAHLLAFTAPGCFTAAALAFVEDAAIPATCIEPEAVH